jgi:hypothetical protein
MIENAKSQKPQKADAKTAKEKVAQKASGQAQNGK